MEENTSDVRLLGRIFKEAREYWIHFVGIGGATLLQTPVALLTPVPIKIAVDSVIGSQPLPAVLTPFLPGVLTESKTGILVLSVGMLIGIALLRELQGFANWYLKTYTGEKMVLDFRGKLFQRLQKLSLLYHDRKGTGDSVYRIQYDAPSIRHAIVDGIIPLGNLVLTVAGMLFIMIQIDWVLALIALTIAPFLFVLTEYVRPRLREQWRDVKELQSGAMAIVQEVLGTLRVVKAFGQEQHEKQRFAKKANRGVNSQLRVVLAEGGFGLCLGVLTAMGTAAVLYVGVSHVLAGVLTVGNLLVVMNYLSQLYDPLRNIGQRIAELQGSLASADRVFSILDQQPEVSDAEQGVSPGEVQGAVSYRNVWYSYDGEQPVLKDITFEVPPGSFVGITGRTGSGKTTLLSMLPRFIDPTRGQILLDGEDIRSLKLSELRDQFAFVLQEAALFSCSIAENISYARPGAPLEDVIQAARDAEAHEFITRCPRGYDTPVGERGAQLSGGERQRVVLARAFLSEAPILVMDEPTRSLDEETRGRILDTTRELIRDRTSFMITHTTPLLEDCDRVLRLENGRLTESAEPKPVSSSANGRNALSHAYRYHNGD